MGCQHTWSYQYPVALLVKLPVFLELTHALERDPEHVPLAIKERNDLIWRSQTLVDGQANVQLLELLGQHVLGHAVVSAQLLVRHETVGKTRLVKASFKDRQRLTFFSDANDGCIMIL